MALRVDCGEFELSCKIVFGVHSKPGGSIADFTDMMPKVEEIRPNLEKTVLYQIADHVGLDEETIKKKAQERKDKDDADREAEEKGRKEKHERRARLR